MPYSRISQIKKVSNPAECNSMTFLIKLPLIINIGNFKILIIWWLFVSVREFRKDTNYG